MITPPNHSELIARLKHHAGREPNRTVFAEAATALQSLTSTIAGLEIDAERYRWLRGDAIYCDSLWFAIGNSVDEAFDRVIDGFMHTRARG